MLQRPAFSGSTLVSVLCLNPPPTIPSRFLNDLLLFTKVQWRGLNVPREARSSFPTSTPYCCCWTEAGEPLSGYGGLGWLAESWNNLGFLPCFLFCYRGILPKRNSFMGVDEKDFYKSIPTVASLKGVHLKDWRTPLQSLLAPAESVFAVNGHLHTSRSLLPATGLVEANTKQYKVNRALPQDPSFSAIGLSQINLNSAYETACLALIL